MFSVLNRCSTPFGASLLRTWLRQPCRSPAAVTARHDAVAALVGNAVVRSDLSLRHYADLARVTARVQAHTATLRVCAAQRGAPGVSLGRWGEPVHELCWKLSAPRAACCCGTASMRA